MREGYNNLHIVTVDGLDRIYEDGGILYEDGVITHVGDRAYIEEKAGELKIELKDGKGRYLFPGLINTHTHLYQDIMKGMGSDLSLDGSFLASGIFGMIRIIARLIKLIMKIGRAHV